MTPEQHYLDHLNISAAVQALSREEWEEWERLLARALERDTGARFDPNAGPTLHQLFLYGVALHEGKERT